MVMGVFLFTSDELEYEVTVTASSASWKQLTGQTMTVFFVPAVQTYNISVKAVNMKAFSGNIYSEAASQQVLVTSADGKFVYTINSH